MLILSILYPSISSAAVCYLDTGVIDSLVTSMGDVGVRFNGSKKGCVCEGSDNRLWLDIDDEGGQSMYTMLLFSVAANKPVKLTISDGSGQGTSGNDSVTYQYWSTCKIQAVEVSMGN